MKNRISFDWLLELFKAKPKSRGDVMMDCVALVFWLGERTDPQAAQSISKICLQLSPMYWGICPPSHIVIIFENTLENMTKIQKIKSMIERGSIEVQSPENIRLGIECGKMMADPDHRGICALEPMGLATIEASANARKATEENRCVGPYRNQ